ncbi:pyridoxamine 5'-phosphate oxidase family protein [Streptomyces antnestii]|uniref:Pyridoxamine 5'-phosphate oxidase family protein n=1 Tax=Streptomyces antnestii TaxID=2494256 RepID=A0A3S2VFL7_9ACTN|nr:pyridoxamine 5'-phosphate oxidase family protein [Streptomyces sp. San01]RVU23923.1 pyridoxamine 5'-phosphate oxidase family protein [Streptomyces sp. San01]
MATYHSGEIAVQERAGMAQEAEFSGAAIGTTVPQVAVDFLAGQPMLVVGAADREGRLWAGQLTGEPGFLRVPGPDTLAVDALPLPQDPLAETLADPASVTRIGMIAIEPATRRRMRMNGRSVRRGTGLHIELDQVISNCPKYLQKREYRLLGPDGTADEASDGPKDHRVRHGTALTPAQQRTVRAADTFFIATASDRADADASHRGGNPGFVQVLSPTLLRWPDYTGNAMFLTLGNLALNPAAGLLFPGWDTGATLQLSGTARTVWDPEEIAGTPGAQRLVEFSVTAVREIDAASQLRWSEPRYSRFNPPVA